ncbi:MAG: hypothetical protein KGO05_12225 [Chloroflexota bacterium]|nr:hypothetical protein [Chloroflexota bacterium]
MFEDKPKAIWFSISVFWIYAAGALALIILVGVVMAHVITAATPPASATPTTTIQSAALTALRYRELVATDNRELTWEISRMSQACAEPSTDATRCLDDLKLVHGWLIQFRSDLASATVPSCYDIVHRHIQDSVTAYLQAEQTVYDGVSLYHAAEVTQGLSAFHQTTANMNDALVTMQSIDC